MTEKYKLEISEPHIEDTETGECYDLHGKDNLIYIVELWNKLVDKNIQSEEDLDYYKAKCSSLEVGMFNLERENEELKQQMQRLYNYFADWFDDRVLPSDFSEMWDFVKEDEKWD